MASNAHGAAYVRLLSLHFKQARKVRTCSSKIFSSSSADQSQPSILIFRGSSSRRFSSFPSVLSADSATNTTAPPPSPPPKSESPSKTVGLETDVPPSLSASQTLAGAVQKLAPATTETYRAYGVCEMLVKECARQADYTIPQALEKKGVIPKTKDGEDLGVGSGQWYKGNYTPSAFTAYPLPPNKHQTQKLRSQYAADFLPNQSSASPPPSTPGPKSPSCTCMP